MTAAEQPALGRREAHKQATRKALQDAADRLFAEQGIRQTTVRDIADAAGVTERTFFRYFASKEDLMLPNALAWMPFLHAAIRRRPAGEPPLLAVRRALQQLLPAITRTDVPSPLTLFADGAISRRLGPSAVAMLFTIEVGLADVLEGRLDDGRPTGERRLRAETAARASVAAFRSAMLYDSQLRRDGVADRPDLGAILDQAFDAIS